MPAAARFKFEAVEDTAQRLLASFVRAGYEHIALPTIQPARLFLDVVGEGLRARTYVFTDPDGEELCLRPDLTVPTCRLHLQRHPHAATPARYCYSGSAFRFQAAGADSSHPREFRQAGVECFAASDREQADADVVAVIAAALRDRGVERLRLRMGDLGLFSALLEALPMPPRWRRRLGQQFWRPDAFRAELTRLTSPAALSSPAIAPELLARLDPGSHEDAERTLAEFLDASAIELIGTRSLAEIADRLLAAAADARETPLRAEHARLIEAYVAVKGPAPAAAERIGKLALEARVDLAPALAAFLRRLELLRAAQVDVAAAEFCAEFGRDLAYYTGFVFEIIAPELGPASPLAGGGRYDGLLADVGAGLSVPAVGACIHTERVLLARGARAP
jgi:ATP phosphoribosyltransferase regulatory subunit